MMAGTETCKVRCENGRVESNTDPFAVGPQSKRRLKMAAIACLSRLAIMILLGLSKVRESS